MVCMLASLVPRPFPPPVFDRLYGGGRSGTFGHVRLRRGLAGNEAEDAVASSLFCIRTQARIGDVP